MTVADLAQPGEIGGWRHDDTAGTHDRLGDDRRNSVRAFSEDRLLDRIGRPSPGLLIARPAIGVGGGDLDEPGHQGSEHVAISGHAGGAHRRQGHAVIGMNARDDLGLFGLVFDLPVITREFERGLVGFGTRCRKIGGGGIGVGMADDLLGEPDGRLVRRTDIGRGKGDPPHLSACCLGQLGAAVADIDVPQPRKPVDVFAALGVVQHRATPLGDDQRLFVIIGIMQRVDEVTPIRFEKLADVVHWSLLTAKPPRLSLTASALPKQRRS